MLNRNAQLDHSLAVDGLHVSATAALDSSGAVAAVASIAGNREFASRRKSDRLHSPSRRETSKRTFGFRRQTFVSSHGETVWVRECITAAAGQASKRCR